MTDQALSLTGSKALFYHSIVVQPLFWEQREKAQKQLFMQNVTDMICKQQEKHNG